MRVSWLDDSDAEISEAELAGWACCTSACRWTTIRARWTA
jgi:hypothetical protein